MKCKLKFEAFNFAIFIKFSSLADLILLALLVSTALAIENEVEDVEEVKVEVEEIEDEVPDVESANLALMNRMRYSVMGNQMTGMDQRMGNPPQKAIEYYSQMKDDDFPVNYNLPCSNSCQCRVVCVMWWW